MDTDAHKTSHDEFWELRAKEYLGDPARTESRYADMPAVLAGIKAYAAWVEIGRPDRRPPA